MKRMVLMFIALASLTFSASLYAQTNAEIIERALTAAPARDRDATSVIKWNADFTYETIKEGTNTLVCFDRSGDPGVRAAFAVHCTNQGNLPREAQNRRFAAASADRDALQAMHRASEEAGTRVAPVFGSVFISRNGDDAGSARIHTTIAVPGATSESLGLPDNPSEGGAWIMQAGSSYAHIMTPGS
jgi:hypothetical protein